MLDLVDDDAWYGFVYLVKGHPGEYKIGRTTLVDRRLTQLGATASVEHELVHEIKTDDPSGVEAYWHRRFHEKRMRGEWFHLNPRDVGAFKRWRHVYQRPTLVGQERRRPAMALGDVHSRLVHAG